MSYSENEVVVCRVSSSEYNASSIFFVPQTEDHSSTLNCRNLLKWPQANRNSPSDSWRFFSGQLHRMFFPFVFPLGTKSYKHWRHAKNFWDTKVTEYVETMPYFVIIFWNKKLTKFSLFKDISWNQKLEKMIFLPNGFLSQEIGRNHTIVLPLLSSYIWRKYSIWDDFLIQENSKKAEIGNIFWCNKWNKKTKYPPHFLMWIGWQNVNFWLNFFLYIS